MSTNWGSTQSPPFPVPPLASSLPLPAGLNPPSHSGSTSSCYYASSPLLPSPAPPSTAFPPSGASGYDNYGFTTAHGTSGSFCSPYGAGPGFYSAPAAETSGSSTTDTSVASKPVSTVASSTKESSRQVVSAQSDTAAAEVTLADATAIATLAELHRTRLERLDQSASAQDPDAPRQLAHGSRVPSSAAASQGHPGKSRTTRASSRQKALAGLIKRTAAPDFIYERFLQQQAVPPQPFDFCSTDPPAPRPGLIIITAYIGDTTPIAMSGTTPLYHLQAVTLAQAPDAQPSLHNSLHLVRGEQVCSGVTVQPPRPPSARKKQLSASNQDIYRRVSKLAALFLLAMQIPQFPGAVLPPAANVAGLPPLAQTVPTHPAPTREIADQLFSSVMFKEMGRAVMPASYGWLSAYLPYNYLHDDLVQLHETKAHLLKYAANFTSETTNIIVEKTHTFFANEVYNLESDYHTYLDLLVPFAALATLRNKRAVFTILALVGLALAAGTVTSIGMGVANSEEVSKLTTNLDAVKKDNSILQERIDVMAAQERNTTEVIRQSLYLLQDKVALVWKENHAYKLHNHIKWLYHNVKYKHDAMKETLWDACRGYLHPRALPIPEMLDGLQKIAAAAHAQGLEIVQFPTALHSFAAATVSMTRNASGTVLHIPIPLHKQGLTPLRLLRPLQRTLTIHAKDHSVLVDLGDEVLALDQHLAAHTVLTLAELSACRRFSDTYFCDHTTFSSAEHPTSCIAAIYFGKLDLARSYCRLSVSAEKGLYDIRVNLDSDDIKIIRPLSQEGLITCPANASQSHRVHIEHNQWVNVPKACFFSSASTIHFPSSNWTAANAFFIENKWTASDFTDIFVDEEQMHAGFEALQQFIDKGLRPIQELDTYGRISVVTEGIKTLAWGNANIIGITGLSIAAAALLGLLILIIRYAINQAVDSHRNHFAGPPTQPPIIFANNPPFSREASPAGSRRRRYSDQSDYHPRQRSHAIHNRLEQEALFRLRYQEPTPFPDHGQEQVLPITHQPSLRQDDYGFSRPKVIRTRRRLDFNRPQPGPSYPTGPPAPPSTLAGSSESSTGYQDSHFPINTFEMSPIDHHADGEHGVPARAQASAFKHHRDSRKMRKSPSPSKIPIPVPEPQIGSPSPAAGPPALDSGPAHAPPSSTKGRGKKKTTSPAKTPSSAARRSPL